MYIPIFPSWAPIDENTREYINGFSNAHKISDYSFTNLYSWDLHDKGRVCDLNGNLALLQTDYMDNEPYYSFIGNNWPRATAETLIDLAYKNGYSNTLKIIPEIGACKLQGIPGLIVDEDPDNHDYILDLVKISRMDGKDFHHLRGSYNQFAKDYGNMAELIELDINDNNIQAMMLDVFVKREAIKSNDHHINELKAVKRIFESTIRFNLVCFGILLKGCLVSFIITEPYQDDWLLAHFMKADTEHRGAYAYLICSVARSLTNAGFTRVNFEQDLGIVGLREAKHLLRPTGVLKKYTIRSATGAEVSEVGSQTV